MKNQSEISTERDPAFTRNAAGRLCLRGVEIYDGPWHAEPDRVEFRHAGFPCLLVRGSLAVWCGYVGTPPGHPWRMCGLDMRADEPDVHGGVTYQAPCHGDICHVPEPGEPDDVVWIGFDCAHAGDLIFPWAQEGRDDVYRDVAYVRRETERLAEQASQVSSSTETRQ